MHSANEDEAVLIGQTSVMSIRLQSVTANLCILLFSVCLALTALSIGLFCLSRDQDKTIQLRELQQRLDQVQDELDSIHLLCKEQQRTASANVVNRVDHVLQTSKTGVTYAQSLRIGYVL